MVGGEIRFALGAVEDQGVDLLLRRRRKFHMGRKRRAAHADQAGRGNARHQIGRSRIPPIDRREHFARFILPVGFNFNRRNRNSHRTGDFHNPGNFAAGRRVQIGRHETIGGRDPLIFFNQIPRLDHRFRRLAGILGNDNLIFRQQRRDSDRRTAAQRLAVAGGVNPPFKRQNFSRTLSHFAGLQSGSFCSILRCSSTVSRQPVGQPIA